MNDCTLSTITIWTNALINVLKSLDDTGDLTPKRHILLYWGYEACQYPTTSPPHKSFYRGPIE